MGRGNNEILGGNPVTVALCLPQIPHVLARYRIKSVKLFIYFLFQKYVNNRNLCIPCIFGYKLSTLIPTKSSIFIVIFKLKTWHVSMPKHVGENNFKN
jgi:hypothetical protein